MPAFASALKDDIDPDVVDGPELFVAGADATATVCGATTGPFEPGGVTVPPLPGGAACNDGDCFRVAK
jgi:hypothetical protein